MPLTSIPELDRTSPTFKSDVDTYFATRIPRLTTELNALEANLDAIAIGGAYAIRYTFDSATADSDPGAGKLRLGSATQNASTVMRLDLTSASGQDVTALIDTFDASTSGVKGSIKLVKQGDVSKWMIFDVTARATATGYRNLTVAHKASSDASPFANNDPVLLQFQRNGDAGVPRIAHLRDEKANGQSGGSGSGTGAQVRDLNAIKYNTIGVTLSANRFTLPAGTYKIFASAPACQVNKHRAYLYNFTDSTTTLSGTNEYSDQTNNVSTRSVILGVFTIAASKTFEIRHYIAASAGTATILGNSGGAPAQLEVFTEVLLEQL